MSYFVLKVAGEDKDVVIDAIPEDAPAEWRFSEGESLADEFPTDAVLKFSANFPEGRHLNDFVDNIMRMLIVSERVRTVFDAAGVPAVEYLPVTFVDHRGNPAGGHYFIANPLGAQPAIDMDRSEYRMSSLDKKQIKRIKRLSLDESAIDADAKLFRASAMRRLILISADLHAALEAAGVTGMKTFAADGWNGLDI